MPKGSTKELRDRFQLCGARKKNGDTCRLFAGQGTPHLGIGRCKHHGGMTPNHMKNAAKVESQRRMVQLGGSVEMAPHEALLAMLHLSSGHVVWLRNEISAQKTVGDFEARVIYQMYSEERDRVARIAKACLDAGVAERQVRLAEEFGQMLADVLRAVFEDKDLAMTREQRALMPAVLQRYLVKAEGNPALVAANGRPPGRTSRRAAEPIPRDATRLS
jgi:hypothetical protein